jgi:hypothetical protein
MSVEQSLKEIKSHEFAARLNVVSSMASFFAAANKEPAVTSLYQDISESGEAREEVLGLIHDLCQIEIDRRYENPSDTALAVLLWLTVYAAPDYSYMAADLVDRASQCWYAKKLARRILQPSRVASGNSPGSDVPNVPRSQSVTSGDSLIIMNPGAKLVHPRYFRGAVPSSGDSSTSTLVNVSIYGPGDIT